MSNLSALDRIVQRVEIESEGRGCWRWTGYAVPSGYGQFGRNTRAHRAVWEELVGPIPNGLHLDHLRRNRACVNPDHLEPVTNAENVSRGDAGKARGAQQKAKTHCPDGHEYAGENLYIHPQRGTRDCRACRREASARARRRRRAA